MLPTAEKGESGRRKEFSWRRVKRGNKKREARCKEGVSAGSSFESSWPAARGGRMKTSEENARGMDT